MSFEALTEIIDNFPQPKKVGVGATDEQIAFFEATTGLIVKGDFRKFLQKYGWIDLAFTETFGLGSDIDPIFNLTKITLSERKEMAPALAFNLIPIFNDGAGNLYCIDASAGDEPPVVFWNHELSPEQEAQLVNNSFSEWLCNQISEMSQS